MRYALISGQRQEAQPGLLGACLSCSDPMVAKCGKVRIWHWAHRGERKCDPWWENETEWHRAWKGQFPAEWQEVVHHSASGEKHIADVKTDQDWVIEFQHSHIAPEERQARNGFYEKLVWVVNGVRQKRDRSQFFNALKKGFPFEGYWSVSLNNSGLLREWANDHAPVFFDFGEESRLWLLTPRSSIVGFEQVTEYPRTAFIKTFRSGGIQVDEFLKLLKTINPPDLPRRIPNLGPLDRRF
ncbi:MAG: competence protein CoiA [Bdellovibrionia bacterium]